MSNGLWIFIEIASLAIVIWGIVDVARRPAVAVAPKSKALWIAGMIGAWFIFGILGAAVSVFYLAGPRKRLNASQYSRRY